MCGRLFVSHCDPAIHRWLVQGVTPAAGARLQHLRDPQCSRSSVTKWTDGGAYYSAEEKNKTGLHVGLMDQNRCSSGEISGKHPAVSVIRIMNILQCIGYAGHMLNILSYSIITVIHMGILKLFTPFKGSGARWLQQRRWAEQIRATSVLPRLRWNWQRVSQVSIFSNTKPSAMTTFRTISPVTEARLVTHGGLSCLFVKQGRLLFTFSAFGPAVSLAHTGSRTITENGLVNNNN